MEHFDFQDQGTAPESTLLGAGLGDSDMSSFVTGLDGAVGNVTAGDEALMSEYGPGSEAGDSSDQVFENALGDAASGTLPADAGTDAWADNLNSQVNDMQAQTDAAIGYAQQAPGGEYAPTGAGDYISPSTIASLSAFNTADEIQNSDYQNFESNLDTTTAFEGFDSTLTGDAD